MTKLPLRLLSCAALAATLAAPAVASAETLAPAGAVLVVDQHGTPVGMLVPAAQPGPDPMLVEMMAMQQAMMRQMQEGFGPIGINAVPAVDSATAAAPGVTISTFSASSDGCSRTMVWRQGEKDAAPRLVVDRVADRCGASATQAPGVMRDAAPDRDQPRLQTIVDRHTPVKRSFTPF